jgi:hypothetical protein
MKSDASNQYYLDSMQAMEVALERLVKSCGSADRGGNDDSE